jgi:hypothetical protein
LTTLERKCQPVRNVRKKLEALSQARQTGDLTIGPARTPRLLIDDPGLCRPIIPVAVAQKYRGDRPALNVLATDSDLQLFPVVYKALGIASEVGFEHIKYMQRHDVLAIPDADSTQDPGRELPGRVMLEI